MRFELRPGVRRLFRLPLTSHAKIHRAIDEELDAFIQSRIDALVAGGWSVERARAEALTRLGASLDDARRLLHESAEHRERVLTMRDLIESVAQDFRYAVRGLIHRPGFTAVAVLTLAIGVGATTAIFSAVDALLLRPLPYARPNELMSVWIATPSTDPARAKMVWSYPKYVTFRETQHVFGELAVYSGAQWTLTDPPERVTGEQVGATYLRTLGLSPVIGHDFDRSVDAHAGAPKEAILGYSLWQDRFGGDPRVIGRTIRVDQDAYTIIGVAPRDFHGLTGQAQLFTPLTALSQGDLWQPYSHGYWLVARRAAGVSNAQAEVAAKAIGRIVNDAYPPGRKSQPWGAFAQPLNDTRLAPPIRRSLLILFGSVGLLLLIGCVNVANLLLGRASAREREISVRVAIGAGRGRLVRLFLTESLLLSCLGAVASMAVAWAGVRWLATLNPASTLRVARDVSMGAVTFAPISIAWSTFGFALGVSVLVGLLFGLAPAFGITRGSLADTLRGERVVGGLGGAMRRGLVVVEVALALVLLAGSALMTRSLANLLSTKPGFDGANVLTMRLTPMTTPGWRDSIPSFYRQLTDRLRAIPGVGDVGLSDCAPLSGGCNLTSLDRKDRPNPDPTRIQLIGVHWASPGWFATMRVPLIRGRLLSDADREGAPRVTVINEQAAKRYWPGEDPIGKHVSIGQGSMDDAEVVGIVGGVRQKADSEPIAEAYVAYAQSPRTRILVFLRSARDAASLSRDARAAIRAIAPAMPVYDVKTMDELSAGATAQARFRAVLLAAFALTALALAAVGIYGVMALAVTARTREMGIRLALGAERARVLRLVVRQGLGMVAIGAAAGLVAALLATRVLRSFLYELSPSDPATYVLIVLVLGGAALLASWVPARRAAAVDPVIALRAE